jgi:hypothetical protein
MAADLKPIVTALADLTDSELHALIEATHGAMQATPGLLALMETAGDWELSRRMAIDYPLQLPDAALPPEKDAVREGAAIWMRAVFPEERCSAAVLALFDALVEVLTGGEPKH